MKAQKMKKSIFVCITTITFLVISLILTGCPNSLTDKNSSEVIVKGSVVVPSALPQEMSRSAVSSYSSTNDGNRTSIKVIGSAVIDGQTVTKEVVVTGNSFELKIPDDHVTWTFAAKLFADDQVIMQSPAQTITIKDSSTITFEPFYLSFVEQSSGSGTNKTGSIMLTISKAVNSSISKIKWQLNPVGSASATPIVFSNEPIFSSGNKALLIESNIPAGTYDAQISFVDSNDFLYGPVTETMVVTPDLTTDTWVGEDSFIQLVREGDEDKTIFQVPSDEVLKNLFPNYSYSNAVTGKVALLWNYANEKLNYSVHPINDNGEVSTTGYPFARDAAVDEVIIDFVTNDMYVQTTNYELIRYKAQSGYSQSEIINCDMVIAAAVDNGIAYILHYDNQNHCFELSKYNASSGALTLIGEVNLTGNAQYCRKFKMSFCDGYIFIAYIFLEDYGDNPREIGFGCDVFSETKISNGKLMSYLYQDYIFYYSELDYTLNDIIAVSKGSDIPDLYALLGYVDCYSDFKGAGALSYGCVKKIVTTRQGDTEIFEIADDTNYGTRGLYSTPQSNAYVFHIHYTPDESSTSCFYNPAKIVGRYSTKFIIADDGASFVAEDPEIQSSTNYNRLVTMDLSATTFTQFEKIQDVNVTFGNEFSGAACAHYQQNSGQQGAGTGPDYFDNAYSQVKIDNRWEITIKRIDDFGDTIRTREYPDPVKLPAVNDRSLYFEVYPVLAEDVLFNAALYCNGKDLNEGVEAGQEYYTTDPLEGTFNLLRPVPSMGDNKYTIVLEVTQYIPVQGAAPIPVCQDFVYDAIPATEFLFQNQSSKAEFEQLLSKCLFGDTVVISPRFDTGSSTYSPTFDIHQTIQTLHDYLNTLHIQDLTLDYKLVKGLDTIMAGEFGINCKQIIFPVKTYSSTITVETIEKGAFSKNGINFEGDLVLHKSLKSVQIGAFEVPPRSISMNEEGYAWDPQINSWRPKSSFNGPWIYNVMKLYNSDSVENTLFEYDYSKSSYKRIITCTKCDQAFELDLSQETGKWKKVETIDDNAFKGLPVTSAKISYVSVIGQSAFEDTPLTEITATTDLKLIGYKAFPEYWNSSLTIPQTTQSWYKYSYDSDSFATNWDYCVNNSPQSILDTENYSQITGSDATEVGANILAAINTAVSSAGSGYFVFKR